MKRILNLGLLLAVLLGLLPIATTHAAEREHTLKIYNWADYIDEDLLNEFKVWYKEQTGEQVDIIYQVFDINEVMLAKLEKGHEDFDVVCPSEYIIERMLANNMLLPIDRNFGKTPDYIKNVSPYAQKQFALLDKPGRKANDYAVGYMWGTTGVLYNPQFVTDEEADTWGILWNDKFNNKILMKDAYRDIYGPMLMYARYQDILSGKVTREQLMNDSSDEAIAIVENLLKDAKKNISGWEVDFGKEMMTKGQAYLNISWSGDAVWAIDEAAAVNLELKYHVPHEGSNVWFDGWVIPKYAKNTKAASYFINFMCRPDNALRNMDEIGYVSVVASPEILEAKIDNSYEEYTDLTYFFGEGADSVHINSIQYPDQKVIDRCALMRDCGSRTKNMLEMWSRIKGDNLDSWVIILIVVVVAGGLAIGITNRIKKHKKNQKYRKKKRKR